MYHFISGYTSKLAGTEMGVTSPVATFSACFGAAFLPLHPLKYAQLLGNLIRRHKVKVWLVNTGWVSGPYGTGSRIKLAYTRAMIHAVLDNQLDNIHFQRHEIFGLHMPVSCPGVPRELLNPEQTWSDKRAYAQQANKLTDGFRKNMARYIHITGSDLAITDTHSLNSANI
jgi:phosphoenolpyruvate carboxykinase (ATP)